MENEGEDLKQYYSVIAYCDLCSYGSQKLLTEEEVRQHVKEQHAGEIGDSVEKSEGDSTGD